MLQKGLVSAILVPQEIPSRQTAAQTLVCEPEMLEAANPLAPVFGVNSARIIARMCLDHASRFAAEPVPDQEEDASLVTVENPRPDEEGQQTAPEGSEDPEGAAADADEPQGEELSARAGPEPPSPIAVVLRPCEVRALVELVKLQQATMAPFFVIGMDCWGTYSVEDYAAKASQSGENGSVTEEFLQQVTAGEIPGDLRGACRGCQHPVPTHADLAIQLIGEDITRQIRVQAQTEDGQDMLRALELEETAESSERPSALATLKDAKKQLADQDQFDFLEAISSLCINCHNCRAACPICYCKQCVFEGQVFEYPMEKYLNWAGKRGILGMPTDKLLFHLTRMSHVASSCVACGQCEAACPSGIPLGRVYQKVSAAAQEALDYEAGRSLAEELPLTTFREDELSVFES
jgi:formate dehydrogenase subunit beta